ncbi:MAG: metal ABC transporter ATP-binding protein [Anaerovibrio sp.]|uniref:metal ABC transporter ATP-binding protein n=1 Tax=Anaerovibrio sp. TaxID=1872532 RepID=UPI0025E2531C|nr:metal ABC transporter ATP-binding protein [Anaerovibrio sp.]MCR5176583.1 metal ABC transporter ATP-binding protein [Anaerovibrio sp.]
MLRRLFRHSSNEGNDCTKLCCTKIEHFTVKTRSMTIFEDVNLHLHCGELMAIIGPNGAGKSTLLRAIIGEVKHTGTLKYVDAKGQHTGKPVIGYVPQFLKFDVSAPVTVLDLFSACLSNRPVWLFPSNVRQQVIDTLKRVKAESLIDRRLGALSGGELQRVLLALALNPMPDILLLDEPVSGVDKNGLEIFYNILEDLQNSEDMAIILVSHDLDMVARHADRVVLMDKGVICTGTPQEVFSDKRTRKIFGMLTNNGVNYGSTGFVWVEHKKSNAKCNCPACSGKEGEK